MNRRSNWKRVGMMGLVLLLLLSLLGCEQNRQGGEKETEGTSESPSQTYSAGFVPQERTGIREQYLATLQNSFECTDTGVYFMCQRMMRASNRHEKEYKVTVDREITDEFLEKMAAGVPILDTVTRPCKVRKIGKYTFSIILTQGLNRQIRRMCEALGYEVKDLLRVRVMNIRLGSLKEGEYRELTDAELEELYEMIQDSPAR